jgi:predicted PurR-regulated permease PerM
MHPQHREPGVAAEIAGTLGAWLVGQAKIAGILTLIYAVGYALSGVPWWPVVAVVGGLLQFVPVIGSVIGFLVALAATYFFNPNPWALAGVVATYAIAQGLEGFYLTPKILGRRLKLSPIAVFLAILIGGFAFGPLGVVFAAPALAAAMIVWRRNQKRVQRAQGRSDPEYFR